MIPIVDKGEGFSLLSEEELTKRVSDFMEGKYLKEALMKIGFTKWAPHLQKEFCDKTGIVKIDGYAEPILQSSLKEEIEYNWDDVIKEFQKLPYYEKVKSHEKYDVFVDWLEETYPKPLTPKSIRDSDADRWRIKEDNICPETGEQCDDECCPVGAICNLHNSDIQDCEPESASLKPNKLSDSKVVWKDAELSPGRNSFCDGY